MDDVEAHVAGPRAPDDGVQVRAVVVEERAAVVEDLATSSMPSSKSPSVDGFVSISPAVRSSTFARRSSRSRLPRSVVATFAELEPGHRHARRVRAVRRVGGDDHVPPGLAAIGEHRAHEHQPRELALRAGRGLQRDGGKPGHLGEDLLQLPHQLERALGALVLLQRVEVAEPGEGHDALVDPRVVLHRAEPSG